MPLQRTNPRRKVPAGLESGCSRYGGRIHRPLDNACLSIDAEDIHHDFTAFDHDLREDMATLSLLELSKRHPELTFHTLKSETKQPRPKGWDYAVDLRGARIWRVARWRKAA